MIITEKNTKKEVLTKVDFGQRLTFWSTSTKVNPIPKNPKSIISDPNHMSQPYFDPWFDFCDFQNSTVIPCQVQPFT